MLGFGAAMEADALPHRLIAFRLIACPRNASDQRQQPLKLWGLGDGNAVAECGDLIAHTLEGIAEPSTIDDEASGNGGALGLISNQSYIHNFLGVFYYLLALCAEI